jgi:hypothetical protein
MMTDDFARPAYKLGWEERGGVWVGGIGTLEWAHASWKVGEWAWHEEGRRDAETRLREV